jgi:dTDP-4-amino-4,6-dideoxygalactose transaminase
MPRFVDSEDHTGNIDTLALESAITERTRAIAVVHYLGVPANMREITEIARRRGLFVLEDCALALGARIKDTHVGLIGDAGVFSFYPVKHITTTEGGMIITKDANFAARLRLLRAFGVDRTHSERTTAGIYDAIELGFNYRMSEVNAAIGLVQLGRVEEFLKRRQENFESISRRLEGRLPRDSRIIPQPCNNLIKSSHYCMSLMLNDDLAEKRTEIMKHMLQNGVGTSIYYPHPVPRMSYYRLQLGCEVQVPRATRFSDQSLALPVGPHLSPEDCDYVSRMLLDALDEIGSRL